MTGWSSSHFLQSLGWAILNSFWQMAVLWIIYLAVNHCFKLSASRKYNLSVIGITTGFSWFVFTFFYYLQTSPSSSIGFLNGTIEESNSFLQMTLLSASIAYIGLLVFPSYKLYRNWRFVQTIKKQGLEKAGLNYRLFVQKIAGHLGITKKVLVFASELVRSPMTIGYLKPIILVPVAALNNLSTQQIEAILLHELSHIRRFDYLVNFMISIINTILYFNPFVKQFMRNIEEERENCCDEMVLQFGYDKLGYASALLTLEKLSAQHQVLALCATGKNYLLNRIEKIVGMEKKKGFRLNHIAGFIAALFCIVVFNSILIIREKKEDNFSMAYEHLGDAFNFFKEEKENTHSVTPQLRTLEQNSIAKTKPVETPLASNYILDFYARQPLSVMTEEAPLENMLINVAVDDIDASLTSEEKENVKSTVDATQRIITTLQWKEVDKVIADAMTEQEKAKAKAEYMMAFEQQNNMKALEQNLKAQYEKLDWESINKNVTKALAGITLDSLENVYTNALVQLEIAKAAACANGKVTVAPMPDQSIMNMQRSAEVLRSKVECIQQARNPKKVVRL